MTAEIVIDLNANFHGKSSRSVKVDDVLWVNGHSSHSGCRVTLRTGEVLKSTNDTITIRQRIDEAKTNNTDPQRG